MSYQRDAFVDGIPFHDVDGPAARLKQLIAVRFPLVPDACAAIGDQARKLGVVGKGLTSLLQGLFDRQDQERMPSGGVAAVQHKQLGIVG